MQTPEFIARLKASCMAKGMTSEAFDEIMKREVPTREELRRLRAAGLLPRAVKRSSE